MEATTNTKKSFCVFVAHSPYTRCLCSTETVKVTDKGRTTYKHHKFFSIFCTHFPTVVACTKQSQVKVQIMIKLSKGTRKFLSVSCTHSPNSGCQLNTDMDQVTDNDRTAQRHHEILGLLFESLKGRMGMMCVPNDFISSERFYVLVCQV